MVNPFTAQVSDSRVEVARCGLINWNGKPVATFEVVQHMTPLTISGDLGPRSMASSFGKRYRFHLRG